MNKILNKLFLFATFVCNMESNKIRKQKNIIRVPNKFSGYFWDCDFKLVNFKKYKGLILERLLGYGRLEALLWVLKKISLRDVNNFLKSNNSKKLDRKSYLFWTKISRMRDLWQLK